MSEEHADWRLNPVTERELAENRRLERKRRQGVWFLVLASIGLTPFACCGACYGLMGGPDNWLGLLLAAGSVGLFVFFLVRYNRVSALAKERRWSLRGEFGDVAGWHVEVSILQGEARSGWDLGVVWFEGDRLYFTGARTSFGLGTSDVRSQIVEGEPGVENAPHLYLSLVESSPAGLAKIGLRFVSLEPEAHSTAVGEAGFRYALRGWLAAGGQQKGQLPPFGLGPDLDSIPALQLRAIAASLVWPGYGAVLIAIGVSQGSGAAMMFAFTGLLVALWGPARSPRRSWLAVRDRRRLEAYNKEQ